MIDGIFRNRVPSGLLYKGALGLTITTGLLALVLRATKATRVGPLPVPKSSVQVLTAASVVEGCAAGALFTLHRLGQSGKTAHTSSASSTTGRSEGASDAFSEGDTSSPIPGHNPKKWRKEFKKARNDWTRKALRRKIGEQTLQAISDEKSGLSKIPCTEASRLGPFTLTHESSEPSEVKISVVRGDIALIGRRLKECGFNPMIMNMANGSCPGGGFKGGAGAEEEYLCRVSNYYPSLEAVQKREGTYDLSRKWSVLYTPDVTFFRGTESEGYPLLKEPVQLSVGAIAAHRLRGKHKRIPKQLVDSTRQKIAAYIHKGLEKGHDVIVIGALGCGAFNNPPKQIAELCAEVLGADQFKEDKVHIVFAIFDDHNSPNGGNVQPFADKLTNGAILNVNDLGDSSWLTL